MSKRLFDVVLSLSAISLFSPLLLLIGLLIYFEDRQPILFKQLRVGLNKKEFITYKFRSMRRTEVTKTGRLIRKTGLDELPQFINVLKGDMSIVGPRPLIQSDIVRLGWNTSEYSDRWKLKPGITGLAQLFSGKGRGVSWELDSYYLANGNIVLDIKIILFSFLVNIFGKDRVKNFLTSFDYL